MVPPLADQGELRSAPGVHAPRVDVSLLHVSDRACLRLLERTRVATADQLGVLVYPSHRTALRRTRNLWLAHLIVRVPLPPRRGGIPVAYRLSETGRRRIHSPLLRSSWFVTARHSLDGVELVAALVRHDRGLVELWYPEWLIPELEGVEPDQLVVLDTGDASAVLLVEVDESTERPPIIRGRLRAYAHLFAAGYRGWQLLWVTESGDRLERIRQIARQEQLGVLTERCWGVAIDAVSARGGAADVLPVGWRGQARPLRSIATDPRARRMTPVPGSPAWVAFLAAGALEAWTAAIRDGVARDGPGVAAGMAALSGAPSPKSALRPDGPAPVGHGSPEGPSAGPRAAAASRVERLDPVLLRWANRDLAELIVGRTTAPDRAIEAARVLRDHLDWSGLATVATILCTSSEPERIRLGIAIIDRAAPITVGPRETCRTLLLGLIDPDRGADICAAAIAALGRLAER